MGKYELTRSDLMALTCVAMSEICKEHKLDREEGECVALIVSDVMSKVIAHLDGVVPMDEDKIARAKKVSALTDAFIEATHSIFGGK